MKDMIRVGNYAFAKELSNGEWSLYLGRWRKGTSKLGHVTELRVCRDAGRPIRFTSLKQVKEYTKFRAL